MQTMEHSGDFHINERYFYYEGKIIVHGDMYVENSAAIDTVVVEGNCFVKGMLRTQKMEVLGELHANKIGARELRVNGDSEVTNLSGKDFCFNGNLKVGYAELPAATIIVGKTLQADSIFGEYLQLSIGKQTK